MSSLRLLPMLALLLACSGGPSASSTSAEPAESSDTPLLIVPSSTKTAAGWTYLELYLGGAQPGDAVPTVIALQGRGDTMERHGHLFQEAPYAVRLLIPKAPLTTPKGTGAWFDAPLNRGDQGLIDALNHGAEALLPWLAAVHTDATPPSIIGWAQGGMVGLTLALQHPDKFDKVIMAGGWLPKDMPVGTTLPAGGVHLLHADQDPVLPARHAEATQAMLPGASLQVLPLEGHLYATELRVAALEKLGLDKVEGYEFVIPEDITGPDTTPPPGSGPDGLPKGATLPPSATPTPDEPVGEAVEAPPPTPQNTNIVRTVIEVEGEVAPPPPDDPAGPG